MLLPNSKLKNEKGEDIYVTEQHVDQLLDKQAFDNAQKQAEDQRKRFDKAKYHQLRAKCKRDLFFFSWSILGNTRMTVGTHGPLCNQVRNTRKSRFREYLLPRDFFKSTILTIAHSIQIILPYTKEDAEYDDDHTELGWPYSLGTDCRLLIAHETHESAARFLYSITDHVLHNTALISLFPEIVPSLRKHRINKGELELPRQKTGTPEPTIDTLGVGGKSQGRHYNYIKLDDIYGDKARDSEAESKTTKQWFDNIQSFFSVFAQDHFDLIGTRYSFDDIYAHAEEMYADNTDEEDKWVRFHLAVEKTNPVNGLLEPTFPEEFPLSKLTVLKKNTVVFDAQYLNDPTKGSSGFKSEWKKFFYYTARNTVAYFTGDKDNPQRHTENIRDFHIAIIIDPSVGKSGGFVVVGTNYKNRNFALSSLLLAGMQPPDLVNLIFNEVSRWQPSVVAIESDIFASVYEHYLNAEMKIRGIRFKVQPVHTLKREKDSRILGLTNYFSSGNLLLNEEQKDLLNEYDKWGKSKNIHILDALAYLPEVARPGWAPGLRESIAAQSRSENVAGSIDISTGYSAQ